MNLRPFGRGVDGHLPGNDGWGEDRGLDLDLGPITGGGEGDMQPAETRFRNAVAEAAQMVDRDGFALRRHQSTARTSDLR